MDGQPVIQNQVTGHSAPKLEEKVEEKKPAVQKGKKDVEDMDPEGNE